MFSKNGDMRYVISFERKIPLSVDAQTFITAFTLEPSVHTQGGNCLAAATTQRCVWAAAQDRVRM